nr:spermidine/putrescine ABC transporter substrate-binding protein [Vibrio ichthyoenteri]
MWEDTLSPEVIVQWQKQSASTLKFTHFDNDDERNVLMSHSERLPFDIIVLDNVSAQIYGQLGRLENLSHLENRDNQTPQWQQACGDYAMPYFWGVVGIVYRKDKVPTPPKTWQAFIEPPAELSGHIGMINDTVETFLPVLSSLGIVPETENSQLLQQSFTKMTAFSQHVLTYEYVLSFVRSNTDAEQLYMALAYSGDEHSLNRYQDQAQWAFTLPQGTPYIWVDCIAVNKTSNNKQLAMAFLDYLSDPTIAAKNATDVKAATTNRSALKLLPQWYLNDASLAPQEAWIEQGQIDTPLSAANISLRAKVINRILKHHETQH